MLLRRLYDDSHRSDADPRRIAVLGSGISGLSCAWLLSQRHAVTLFESESRLGGHSNTVTVADPGGPIPIDIGFIVYNERTYPNLTALFAHIDVATAETEMSFAVSRYAAHRWGGLEYSGTDLKGLFAQKINLLRPRFWRMLAGILRFYREAPAAAAGLEADLTSLGDYLDVGKFSLAMQEDHLLPMAAAIWSCGARSARDYPATAFIRFCENHGLLQIRDRPAWRSVIGGSVRYVAKLAEAIAGAPDCHIRLDSPVIAIARDATGVTIHTTEGAEFFDDVVIAAHAPEALSLLNDASDEERQLLGSFGYSENLAVLHEDPSFMPRRRAAWSSWNVIDEGGVQAGGPCVTYWMNRLQNIKSERQFFVTLNPPRPPMRKLHGARYEHPLFDASAMRAQKQIWSLQGQRRTWFCGAYFGAGFHEDGLQAGLAVAEALGGVQRPWEVQNDSSRICVTAAANPAPASLAVPA